MRASIFCLVLALGTLSHGAGASARPRSPKTAPDESAFPNGVVIIGNPLPPEGKSLPAWFSVTFKQPRWWGAPDYQNEVATVRITFDNRSEQEINLLNLHLWDGCFVVTTANGRERKVPVKFDRASAPWINPQTIIGPRSRVSFDVQFHHPVKKSYGVGARFRSEATMYFWMRDYLDGGQRRSFGYTIPFSVVNVQGASE